MLPILALSNFSSPTPRPGPVSITFACRNIGIKALGKLGLQLLDLDLDLDP